MSAPTEEKEKQMKINPEIRTADVGEEAVLMASAASSSNSSNNKHEMLLVRPIAISFATAMVDLCMANMFSYLNRDERIDCSTVAKMWYHSVRHPTTWRKDHFTYPQAERAPAWLRACIGKMNIEEGEMSLSLSELTQVRRLRFGTVNEKSKTMNVQEMKSALRCLKKLDELAVYQVQAPDIWAALFQRGEAIEATAASTSDSASVQDSITVVAGVNYACDPVIWSWESTLERIWIAHWDLNSAYPTPPFSSMLSALTQKVWHRLESFSWNFGGEQSADTMTAFQQLLQSKSIPSLTHMQLQFLDQTRTPRGDYHALLVKTLAQIMKSDLPKLKDFNGRFLSRNRILVIPAVLQWPSLTSIDVDAFDESFGLSRFPQLKKLKLNRCFFGSTLAFFQSIAQHSLPHLDLAIIPLAMIQDTKRGGVSEADSQIVRCILSEMKTLTNLKVIFEHWNDASQFCWLNHINVLPSLTRIELSRVAGFGQTIPSSFSIFRSISAMTALQRFHLTSPDILTIAHLLELTSVWSTRAAGSDCLIEELYFEVIARQISVPEEEESLCTIVKNLASLSHLTDFTFRRHLSVSNPGSDILRRVISDDAIASSYLPHLRALKKLQMLHADDFHYTLTPTVLTEWTRCSDVAPPTAHFSNLQFLQIGFAKSTSDAFETAILLDRFPQLEQCSFSFVRGINSTESEMFLDQVKAFIKQRNDEGRRPRIAIF